MQIRRQCKCGCGKVTKPGNKWIHGHHRRVRKIRRRCKCGCGRITNPGRRYISGHNSFGNTYGKGNKGIKKSKEHKKKLSLAKMGIKKSGETKVKISISKIKCHPDDPYCDIWRDKEYKKDLRKDYCENMNCKGTYKKLNNHHIDLDKKNCHPKNIMTLCVSCHASLHCELRESQYLIVNPKDFLIINKLDHVSYINKKTRKKITIRRQCHHE